METQGNQIKLAVDEGNVSTRAPLIVCIDDEETNLEILEIHLKKSGLENKIFSVPELGLEFIKANADKIDVVILDIMMPGLDGITLLKNLKADAKTAKIPVIMQTAMTGEQKTVEGIEAGAYYYVTKPYSHSVLLSIVKSALKEKRENDNLKTEVISLHNVIDNLKSCVFELKTFSEARRVANYISRFSIDPNKYIVGLTALIINAIEHGNLEIGFDLKNKLLVENKYDEEVERRLQNPLYGNRKVKVELERKETSNIFSVIIRDEGKGFNWQDYMDFDPNRMADPNGRGIAMANIMSPGIVEFWGKGNVVIYNMPVKILNSENIIPEMPSANIRFKTF
jgi:DNA-binding response OmpR family regulator